MNFYLTVYTYDNPREGETRFFSAACGTEARNVMQHELQRRIHRIREAAGREWAMTRRERRERRKRVLGEIAWLHVDMGKVREDDGRGK